MQTAVNSLSSVLGTAKARLPLSRVEVNIHAGAVRRGRHCRSRGRRRRRPAAPCPPPACRAAGRSPASCWRRCRRRGRCAGRRRAPGRDRASRRCRSVPVPPAPRRALPAGVDGDRLAGHEDAVDGDVGIVDADGDRLDAGAGRAPRRLARPCRLAWLCRHGRQRFTPAVAESVRPLPRSRPSPRRRWCRCRRRWSPPRRWRR